MEASMGNKGGQKGLDIQCDPNQDLQTILTSDSVIRLPDRFPRWMVWRY